MEHRLGDRPDRIPTRRQTDAQVFLNGQLRKDLASLGNVADAEARPERRRATRQLGVLKLETAGGNGQDAHDGLEQRGLADPVPAHQAGAGPGLDVEVNIP